METILFFIYPVLFMIIPLLLFYANNPIEMAFGRIRMLLITMTVTVIGFMLVLHYVCGFDYSAVAPIACGAILIFYTSGARLKRFAHDASRLASRYAHQYILKYLAIVIFCYFVVTCPKFSTIALDIVALITSASILMVRRIPKEQKQHSAQKMIKPEQRVPFALNTDKPDIYVIILDAYHGYLSSKAEGYDNPFFQQLRDRGLFVSDVALSSYQRTLGSIPSIIDMDYNNKQNKQIPWWDYTVTGEAPSFLRSIGYKHAVSGYFYAYLKEKFPKDNIKFETIKHYNYYLRKFSDNTIMSFFSNSRVNSWVKHIHASFDACIEMVKSNDSPKFIFKHLMAPHPPFVFKANGAIYQQCYHSKDVQTAGNTWQKYYFGHTEHISVLFLSTLDKIIKEIKKRNNKAIVLIHSDHGYGYDSTSLFSADTLFAAYGHGIDVHSIFPKQLSLVNMYRYLFNSLFACQYEILEYKLFNLKGEDITEELQTNLAELSQLYNYPQ